MALKRNEYSELRTRVQRITRINELLTYASTAKLLTRVQRITHASTANYADKRITRVQRITQVQRITRINELRKYSELRG